MGGDSAIVVATENHRKGLEQRLRSRGLHPATALEQGRYIPLDAERVLSQFLVGDYPDAEAFTKVIGDVLTRAQVAAGSNGRVFAFGEMVAILWAAGKGEAAIRLEQLWNSLSEKYDFSLRAPIRLRISSSRNTASLFCGSASHTPMCFQPIAIPTWSRITNA